MIKHSYRYAIRNEAGEWRQNSKWGNPRYNKNIQFARLYTQRHHAEESKAPGDSIVEFVLRQVLRPEKMKLGDRFPLITLQEHDD